jgi:hypothetical protein
MKHKTNKNLFYEEKSLVGLTPSLSHYWSVGIGNMVKVSNDLGASRTTEHKNVTEKYYVILVLII